MKELIYVSNRTRATYKKLFDYIKEKHGSNYEEALDELKLSKVKNTKFYSDKVKELVEYSSQFPSKTPEELIEVMRGLGKENYKDLGLQQAAFLSAIDNPCMAEIQHMNNILHDQEIIYCNEMNKYEQKIQAKKDAKINGADGGRVFSRKSEELVFIALDQWRIKYQNDTNIAAANKLFNVINEKIEELNQAISISRTTRNTPMLEISEPETIAAWIGGLNKLINNKPFPRKARKCIKGYYVNYYVKDKYYSI